MEAMQRNHPEDIVWVVTKKWGRVPKVDGVVLAIDPRVGHGKSLLMAEPTK